MKFPKEALQIIEFVLIGIIGIISSVINPEIPMLALPFMLIIFIRIIFISLSEAQE